LLEVEVMKRVLPGILLAIALASPARADGLYFTEAVGGTSLGGELAGYIDDGEGGFQAHVGLGMRTGNWAIEAFVTGGELGSSVATDYGYDASAFSFTYAGVDVRRIVPVGRHVEMYVRAGLNSMTLERNVSVGSSEWTGRGIDYGAGVRLKGKVAALGLLCPYLWLIPKLPGPKVMASLFVDVGSNRVRVRGDGLPTLDGTVGGWMIGFAVGSDL
jgi:hypothetical protein